MIINKEYQNRAKWMLLKKLTQFHQAPEVFVFTHSSYSCCQPKVSSAHDHDNEACHRVPSSLENVLVSFLPERPPNQLCEGFLSLVLDFGNMLRAVTPSSCCTVS
jgi:hypothetical protein